MVDMFNSLKICLVFFYLLICLIGFKVQEMHPGHFREGLHGSFATPNPFVLTNKICLNQEMHLICNSF